MNKMIVERRCLLINSHIHSPPSNAIQPSMMLIRLVHAALISFLLSLKTTYGFQINCRCRPSFDLGRSPSSSAQLQRVLQNHGSNNKEARLTQLKFSGTEALVNGAPDLTLASWVIAFSASHIGMSAIRDRLIEICGEFAAKVNIVDRGWKLPSWWLGDGVAENCILPDKDTAGRQIYRMGYTLVSFTTLGSALMTYVSIHEGGITIPISFFTVSQDYILYYAIAIASFAISIASLFNASPLSLVPGFQVADDKNDKPAVSGLQRNDSLKMEPRGLTRITRHPLILPVVPWGLATSYLLGGRPEDFILFGGLSAYAIAGCACQDLRIINLEGSVGTVFEPAMSQKVQGQLEYFFSATSFVPFAAIIDGRQSMESVLKEFPIVPFLLGFPVGIILEDSFLQWLS